MMDDAGVVDLGALEEVAKASLDTMAYDYFAGGADREATLADNEAAWQRLAVLPHVLRGVASVSTSVELFGRSYPGPYLVAPLGYLRLAHDDGEREMARGAAVAGVVMCVSTMATTPLEDVAAATDAPKWFQLYVHRDRGLTAEMVRRAEAAGYEALVFTVDLPVVGSRLRDVRNRFRLPEGLEMANMRAPVPELDGSGLDAYADTALDAGITWSDIGWLRDRTSLPVVIKGVLRPDDAGVAVREGAAGIIVSNHGGRQLDTSIATADALRPVVAAVDGRVPVLVDGGIRSGTDTVKALAMGAAAVLLGRPVLWGLVAEGAGGVARVLGGLRDELERAMALCGASSVRELTDDLVR